MKKRNGDTIALYVGIIVLIVGALTFVYFRFFFEGIMLIEPPQLSKENLKTGNIENNLNVYQFLLDTKNVYCDYEELRKYYRELKDKIIDDEKNGIYKGNDKKYYSDVRTIAKKLLMRDDVLGLNESMTRYIDTYSNYSFPKTINLLKTSYEHFIFGLHNLENAKAGNPSIVENWNTSSESSKYAHELMPKTMIEEYEAIRGKDKTLWPEEEKLLDLKNLCYEIIRTER